MWLPVGRPRHHVSHEWPQADEEAHRPTADYLWDWVAPTHATQAHVYIEYNNELDALMSASVSTCCPFLTFVTLLVVITQISFGTYIFQVTWMPYESPEIMALQESHTQISFGTHIFRLLGCPTSHRRSWRCKKATDSTSRASEIRCCG
jgi:hypothetical protein